MRSGGVDILDLNGNGSTSDGVALGAYVAGNEVIRAKRRPGWRQHSAACFVGADGADRLIITSGS